MRGLLLVFNLLWTCSLSATQAGIIYPPVSANICVGQSAVFSCTAVADVIEWLADNQPASDHKVHIKGFNAHTEPLNSTTGLRRSKLHVAGREENNNVSIICLAFNNTNPLKIDKSDSALLRVQGLLESVSNLTVTLIDSTTVLISWTPPFSLEGVPILGYNVTITNNASEKYETMFVENSTLYYYYDYHDWTEYYNSEDEYYVTVAPNNHAGTGPNVTSDLFTFPPLPSSTTPTVGSSQITSGDATSQGTSPSPSAIIVVPPSIGEVKVSGSTMLALIVTPLVCVLVVIVMVMVVVCVVVKRNRRKNNNPPSVCSSRQSSDVSLTIIENPSVEEPTQQQETQRPVPSNHEPNITTTPQREQNQAQLDNLTVPERVEQPSSLIGESHVLSSLPVNQQRRGSLQRDKQIDVYDRPARAGERPRHSSLTTVRQQVRKNSKGYHQIPLQSSMSTEDEDESKQSSQRQDVVIQVDSSGNQSPTLSRLSPVIKRLQPPFQRAMSLDEQQGGMLPTEACSTVERTRSRKLSVPSFGYRRGSSGSAVKEEHKILLEEPG